MKTILKSIILVTIGVLVLFSTFSFSQSTNQATPTSVISNEIFGAIPARAIGDSRLTNYFFAFNGQQGDVFINIVSQNLDADLDIFTIDGFKALTKITVFSDNSDSETGRIVYLRKFERLLLRVQGRSPNDEPGTFRIKFAGSFEPLSVSAAVELIAPEVRKRSEGEVVVNSVGTIVGRVPKTVPEKIAATDVETPVETPVKETRIEKEININLIDKKPSVESSAKIEISRRIDTSDPVVEPIIPAPNLKAVEITPNVASEPNPETLAKKPELVAPEEKERISDKATPEKVLDVTQVELTSDALAKSAEPTVAVVEPLKPEQLEGIELVVKFKDGKFIKQPLSKVFSFNVNQGILTIVSESGNVSRYSMLAIEKISIE